MMCIKTVISRFLKPGTALHWLASGFYRNPIRFIAALTRSLIATKKLTGQLIPLRVRIGAGQTLKIALGQNSKVQLFGNLLVNPWGGLSLTSSISCANAAILIFRGDFEIGPNVHITVAPRGTLTFGGKQSSTASGITCNSRIMVEQSLTIGSDCIIAWDVFISDSNWHDIVGVERCTPVSIGDRVWISHGVSVLKGAVIPDGTIVGAKSLVDKQFDIPNTLIAGIPAKVLKHGMHWSR